MIAYLKKRHTTAAYKTLCSFIAFAFLSSVILPPQVAAQLTPVTVLNLPVPGTMVPVSSGFAPALMTGVTVNPDNPLRFDFIMDRGQSGLEGEALKAEYTRIIKYFMASLTVPEDELWVNLSPYEKDRMIAQGLGQTEMGRDMLAQDYLLKQLTASLMYPEEELGKKFWDKIYKIAKEKFGTTEIPINTFNKVWIVPDEALVYEQGTSAFVIKSRLAVMLEEDYEAAMRHQDTRTQGHQDTKLPNGDVVTGDIVTPQIIREIIIPEIENEINEGKNFANLRQIYNALILAVWYKQRLKDSLLGKVYVDQNKTKGIDTQDKAINQKIYNQYIESFKKGVYNFIREDYDPATQQTIPRKYFSGGASFGSSPVKGNFRLQSLNESIKQKLGTIFLGIFFAFGISSSLSASDIEQRVAESLSGSRTQIAIVDLVEGATSEKIGNGIKIVEGKSVQPGLLARPPKTANQPTSAKAASPVGRKVSDPGLKLRQWAQEHRGEAVDKIQQEVADEYGVDRTTVSRVFKEFGIQGRGRGRTTTISDPVLKLRQWAQEHRGERIDKSLRGYGEDFGVSHETIRNVFAEFGIQGRGRKTGPAASQAPEGKTSSSPVTLNELEEILNGFRKLIINQQTLAETLAKFDALFQIVHNSSQMPRGHVTIKQLQGPMDRLHRVLKKERLDPLLSRVHSAINSLELGGIGEVSQIRNLDIERLIRKSQQELERYEYIGAEEPNAAEYQILEKLMNNLIKLKNDVENDEGLTFGLFYQFVLRLEKIHSDIRKNTQQMPLLNRDWESLKLSELLAAILNLQFGGFDPSLAPSWVSQEELNAKFIQSLAVSELLTREDIEFFINFKWPSEFSSNPALSGEVSRRNPPPIPERISRGVGRYKEIVDKLHTIIHQLLGPDFDSELDFDTLLHYTGTKDFFEEALRRKWEGPSASSPIQEQDVRELLLDIRIEAQDGRVFAKGLGDPGLPGEYQLYRVEEGKLGEEFIVVYTVAEETENREQVLEIVKEHLTGKRLAAFRYRFPDAAIKVTRSAKGLVAIISNISKQELDERKKQLLQEIALMKDLLALKGEQDAAIRRAPWLSDEEQLQLQEFLDLYKGNILAMSQATGDRSLFFRFTWDRKLLKELLSHWFSTHKGDLQGMVKEAGVHLPAILSRVQSYEDLSAQLISDWKKLRDEALSQIQSELGNRLGYLSQDEQNKILDWIKGFTSEIESKDNLYKQKVILDEKDENRKKPNSYNWKDLTNLRVLALTMKRMPLNEQVEKLQYNISYIRSIRHWWEVRMNRNEFHSQALLSDAIWRRLIDDIFSFQHKEESPLSGSLGALLDAHRGNFLAMSNAWNVEPEALISEFKADKKLLKRLLSYWLDSYGGDIQLMSKETGLTVGSLRSYFESDNDMQDALLSRWEVWIENSLNEIKEKINAREDLSDDKKEAIFNWIKRSAKKEWGSVQEIRILAMTMSGIATIDQVKELNYKRRQSIYTAQQRWKRIIRHPGFPVIREQREMLLVDLFKVVRKSSSPLAPGGIDLNPALLDLQIKRDGNGVPLPLPQQPIETMHIEGFLPVIINIVPISNLPLLLGLDLPAQEEDPVRLTYQQLSMIFIPKENSRARDPQEILV